MSSSRLIASGLTGAIAASVAVVAHYEGKRNEPYNDVIGVRTVCYGDTHGVEERRYSDAECRELLVQQLAEHDAGLMKCIRVPVADNVHAAFLSWAYNVGVGNACGSTAIRRLNAGDVPGACAELSKWTKAAGKELPGLVRRRADERAMCEGRPLSLGAQG